MNIGAKGVRSTVGVGGTGLSYSTYSSHSGTTNMATGQSKSGASSSGLGCLVIGGIIVGAIILIKVLIEAGQDGISFLVGIVGTGCGIGAYLESGEGDQGNQGTSKRPMLVRFERNKPQLRNASGGFRLNTERKTLKRFLLAMSG